MDAPQPNYMLEKPVFPRPPDWRRRRRLLWLLVLVPMLLTAAVVGIAFWLANRYSKYGPVAATLPKQLADARKEGLPLTPSDLVHNPPVPESANAAGLYREMTALIKDDKAAGETFSAYSGGKRDARTTTAVKAGLRQWARPIRLAEAASKRPGCDFQRPWEQGPEMVFPEFAAMRAMARALSARACMENSENRPLDALATVETITRISSHTGEDPIIVGMLVEIAMQAIAARPFREVVLSHIDNSAVIKKARQVSRSFEPGPDSLYSLRGEVVTCGVCFDIIRDQPSGLKEFLGKEIPKGIQSDMTDAGHARVIAFWRSVFKAMRETESDELTRQRRFQMLSDEMERRAGQPTYELAVILLPIFAKSEMKVLGWQAMRRLHRGMLALADFHRIHRRFPTDAESSALIPLDPFTARPLLYRQRANGFILYSVGENFKDDGGTDKRPKKGDPSLDIVIQYPLATNTNP